MDAVAQRPLRRVRRADTPPPPLSVEVEPLLPSQAATEFGAELSTAGIAPVRLRIENRTARVLQFAPRRVRLVKQQGERTVPLPFAEAGARMSAGTKEKMRRVLASDTEVQPGATYRGYLFFPAAAYRRATVILIDRANGEAEGFSVEF